MQANTEDMETSGARTDARVIHMSDHKQRREAQKERRKKRRMRAVRVELIKPLGEWTWDTVGPLLQAYRSVMHQIENAGTLAAIEYTNRARRGEVVQSAKALKDGEVGICNAQTASYRELDVELQSIQAFAAERHGRLKRETLKLQDGEPEKDFQRRQRTLEHKIERAAILARLVEFFPGGTKAALSSQAWDSFKRWQKDRRQRIPSKGEGQPIPIRNQESALEYEDPGLVLSVKLQSHGLVRFAVRAGHGANWGVLRELALGKGELERADVKLVFDKSAVTNGPGGKKQRSGKWYALIAYSAPRATPPKECSTENVLVLHRGYRNLLFAMSSTGKWKIVAHGNKLTNYKRRMRGQRWEAKAITEAERGKGATGHGKKRRYALPERLERRERDWLKTHCQQLASRVLRLAKEWGCGRVAIEDYSGMDPSELRALRRFVEHPPYAMLRDAIKNAIERIGIELETYSYSYISQTCPRCDNQDAAQHNMRTGMFHCKSPLCNARGGFHRPADFVATFHALRRFNGGHAQEWERNLDTELERVTQRKLDKKSKSKPKK